MLFVELKRIGAFSQNHLKPDKLLCAFYPLESWNLPENRNLKIKKYAAKGAMPMQTRIKKPHNEHKSLYEPQWKWNCCNKKKKKRLEEENI